MFRAYSNEVKNVPYLGNLGYNPVYFPFCLSMSNGNWICFREYWV